MGRKPGLGRAESDILRFITDRAEDGGATVREVGDFLAETKGQTRTTALNVMERLREKGFLTRATGPDGVYRYRPSQPKAGLMRGLVRDFVQEMLGGSVEPFVAYLAEDADLTDEQIARLREAVARLEARDTIESDGSKEKEK